MLASLSYSFCSIVTAVAPCPEPPNLANGTIVRRKAKYYGGDELEYRCLDTHKPSPQPHRVNYHLRFE
jgi:hypothetical protein